MRHSGSRVSDRVAGALLGAVLLGPIAWLASVCIVAPGASQNTTSGGMWMLIAGIFILPAGALVGALLGAFAVRRLDSRWLVAAVVGEVLLGIVGALLGRYIGSQLGEVDWGSAGLTHGALVGGLIGVIAGVLYARRRLAKPGKTAQDTEGKDVDRETTYP